MADGMKLSLEALWNQYSQMKSLENEFRSLFQRVHNSLEEINRSWSASIANNFGAKIGNAQKTFESIANMLGNGAEAANAAAITLSAPSKYLEKLMNSGIGKEYFDGYNNIASLSREEVESMFPEKYKNASNISKSIGTVGKALDSVKKIPGLGFISSIVGGGVITYVENNDPDKEINSFIKEYGLIDPDKTAADYVAALNSGNYAEAALDQVMLTGYQIDYDIFNTATNIAGNAFSSFGKFYEGVNDFLDLTGINIQRKECQFMENSSKIIASKLINLM